MNPEALQNYRVQVGENIRDFRQKKKMSQQELAENIGVKENTINKIETGRFNFQIDTIYKISEVLNFKIVFETKE